MKTSTTGSKPSQFIRILILQIFFYLGLLTLGVGLFRVQVIEGKQYRQQSEINRIRLIPLEAPRGRVLDRNGKLLATNRASYDLVATPEDIQPSTYRALSKLLHVSEAEIRTRLRAPREYPFAPAIIEEDIPREMAFMVEQRKPELPGVQIQVSFRRYYPYEKVASHVIGYIGKLGPEEYKNLDRERYGLNSYIGRAGIERTMDETLRGWRGGKQIEVNALGQMIRVLSQRAPDIGQDVSLTLDLDFQKKIVEAMADKRAAVAVMDLQTEGLLAMASTPSYDPNIFVSPGTGKERLQLLRDKDFPMLDRGIGSGYPPGSVFKLVTALAGLETGKIAPNTHINCAGLFRLKPNSRPYKCWKEGGHGSLDLYEAIERSCNVFFYTTGSRLSPDIIAKYSHEMGLGEPISSLEATNISTGLVPDEAWKRKRFQDKWYQGETLSFAIGQSYLLTTPMQILRMVSIIAKDGKKTEPHLVTTDELPDFSTRARVSIQEENFKVIKKGMMRVVESDYGTGQFARVAFGRTAAKTGTAQAPPKVAHSWMAGFFPAENPKISFVVFVQHGGPGGVTGAKIIKQVLESWHEIYEPPPPAPVPTPEPLVQGPPA